MRVSADGFIDIRDGRKVRTPGNHESDIEPQPEAEALAFLLSHSFPGRRHMVRGLSLSDRRLMRMAAWANSVSERMALVDRVWRRVTDEITVPVTDAARLVQVIQVGGWAYPLHVEGTVTRVLPPGGVPMAEIRNRKLVFRLDRKTA
jgi:hypothetical protein